MIGLEILPVAYQFPSPADLAPVAELATRAGGTSSGWPPIWDLQLMQGDDIWIACTIGAADGSAVDLTGYTAQAQIRPAPADETEQPLITFLATVVPPDEVLLNMPGSSSILLTRTPLVWDVQVTSPLGQVSTVASGSVSGRLEVTRP